jgi:Flp pilus assembly protein TadG
MKRQTTYQKILTNNRGATAVIVAICLTMLVGFAALALDVGYLYATRNELQNVADAGALAGAGYLGTQYTGLSYSDQQTYTFARTDIVATVNEVSLKNKAGGVDITINDADVTIGIWDADTRTVTPTLTAPDAVRVIARRDSSANSPISTFFARIFGIQTMDVSAVATAALTGPATVDEGELKTPFGLSENVFPNDCTEEIIFSPTTDSCAGWHNFFDPANANAMDQKLLGLIKGDGDGTENNACLTEPCGQAWLDAHFEMNSEPDAATTPETTRGESFNFQGGNIASLFLGGVLDGTYDGAYAGGIIDNPKKPAPFPALFDYFRYRDGDGNDDIWTATVPIYKDGETCTNPTGPMEIIGFAEITIKMPNPPPDTSVSVWVDCNQSFVEGRGGGGTFGNLKGTIPNLVE